MAVVVIGVGVIVVAVVVSVVVIVVVVSNNNSVWRRLDVSSNRNHQPRSRWLRDRRQDHNTYWRVSTGDAPSGDVVDHHY